MSKYREILRLLSNGQKTDEIVHACSVSKKTVIKTVTVPLQVHLVVGRHVLRNGAALPFSSI